VNILGLGMGELMSLVKDPSKVAGAFARIAPVSLHTMGRKRLYEEICALAALLSRNSHNLLTAALLNKTEIPPEQAASLNDMEFRLLTLASKLNEFRKVPFQEMTIEKLKDAYGFAPQGAAGNGAQAGDAGNAATGDGHASAA
jgi:hypothetical protein